MSTTDFSNSVARTTKNYVKPCMTCMSLPLKTYFPLLTSSSEIEKEGSEHKNVILLDYLGLDAELSVIAYFFPAICFTDLRKFIICV